MKIISLIPLSSGTEIYHFISSFAMIEKDEMVILDLSNEPILVNMLKAEQVFRYGNNSIENMSESEYMKKYRTRFNNKLIAKATHLSGVSKNIRIDKIL